MEKNGKTLISNKDIVDGSIDLLRTCVDIQFQRLCQLDGWKNQFKEDFINDLIIVLYRYSPEKLNDAYRGNHLNALYTRIILNNIYSKTSNFYRTYLKYPSRVLFNLETYQQDVEHEEPEADAGGFGIQEKATPDDKYEDA